MSNLLREGAICQIRRESGDWRVINRRFDGHVHQYLMQSLNNGATVWRFLHEITEKNSSTYQELNDFLQTVANDFDEDIFEDNFINNDDGSSLLQVIDTETVEHVSTGPPRFKQVTQSSMNTLKASNTEATTNKQTKWAVKILKDYMMEAGFGHSEFEMMPVAELDALLEQFYAALLSKTGKEYSKPTLVSIRAGINRHITALPFSRKLSLMRDRDFVESNKVMSGKMKILKREGKDMSEHKEPISDKDLEKLYISGVFCLETPVSLQKKVMFEIIAQFRRRGREGLQNQ
ncbi:uncharacterized protein LOC128553100 [Mercenaria mercenaria]|uniref:uncharacterized protein LOC128553100 n=1 Tax=Mercenaria mercenaria TaxID=6596 RepID=UPI00234F6E1D|nr:uncharacterized protein LOC128553100 [Mercenaria mercenaria]